MRRKSLFKEHCWRNSVNIQVALWPSDFAHPRNNIYIFKNVKKKYFLGWWDHPSGISEKGQPPHEDSISAYQMASAIWLEQGHLRSPWSWYCTVIIGLQQLHCTCWSAVHLWPWSWSTAHLGLMSFSDFTCSVSLVIFQCVIQNELASTYVAYESSYQRLKIRLVTATKSHSYFSRVWGAATVVSPVQSWLEVT